MAIKYTHICDRCNKEIKRDMCLSNPYACIEVRSNKPSSAETLPYGEIMLCDDCMESFRQWYAHIETPNPMEHYKKLHKQIQKPKRKIHLLKWKRD